MTIRSLPALLAVLAAAAPASAATVPAEQLVLDVFKAACSRTGDSIAPMKADAVRAGWVEMPEAAEPRIARLVKTGREAAEKDGSVTGATFRRPLGGRDIFLIVSRYQDKSGFWGTGCRVYDFEATKPLDPRLLSRWMGKPPTGVQTPAPGLVKRLWEPGWKDGITLEIAHVPQNHPFGKTYSLSGNILVAQAIGGF